ncbi:MAG: hypothetical protein ACE5JU_20875 [Candidatus Binatia bacterium]
MPKDNSVRAVKRRGALYRIPPAQHFSVSSRWLCREDVRFDASTYAQEGYEALRVLEMCRYETLPLGEFVARVYHPTENQPRSNFKRIWVSAEEGVPFLSGRQLFFFRPNREKFLSQKMAKLHELQVPKGTILLSRSGTTGYPVLVGKWLSSFAVTDDALRIFPSSVPIGFVYAFLASSMGHSLVVKGEYGKTVSHLEAKHVSTIPVPLLPVAQQTAIHEKILHAYRLRDEANNVLDEADLKLHRLLGVSPFTEKDIEFLGDKQDPRAFITPLTGLGDRFDATHHVPVARSAIHKLEGGRFGLADLGGLVDKVYVAPRFARIYVGAEFGVPLLQGSQLPLLRPYGLKYISKVKTEKIERWIIRAGWVLVTCSGTIGRVTVTTRLQDGWAASQHILRIIPKPRVSHPGFIAAFLATPFGQHQLKAKAYGGVVDELTAEDTASVCLPDVPFRDQERLGEAVLKAYEMRDEANAVEEEAIRELEILIRASAVCR